MTATDMVSPSPRPCARGVVESSSEFFGPASTACPRRPRHHRQHGRPEYGNLRVLPPSTTRRCGTCATGRTGPGVDLVERYMKEQGLDFRTKGLRREPVFTDTIELDLSTVEPSLAGPKRPQDRVPLRDDVRSASRSWPREGSRLRPRSGRSHRTRSDEGRHQHPRARRRHHRRDHELHQHVEPRVMLGAGLVVAKKAVAKGLNVKPYVKTSLAPGSKVVTEYLRRSRASWATSKPSGSTWSATAAPPASATRTAARGVESRRTTSTSSPRPCSRANRNFEGRVNPDVKANYLASPPLVVAYALAGTTDIDFATRPIGKDKSGRRSCSDIWPTMKEVADAEASVTGELFTKSTPTSSAATRLERDLPWPRAVRLQGALDLHPEPPFFMGLSDGPPGPLRASTARGCWRSSRRPITTDHISPAGDIASRVAGGDFLQGARVEKKDFNSYGARRGNDRVMVRGTFANIRLKNLMVPGSKAAHRCSSPAASGCRSTTRP